MSRTAEHAHGYVPGMGHDWLLPLYDPFTRLLGVGSLHEALVDQAGVQPGQRVLEIGCGTGNLTLAVKRRVRDAAVTGLDPDPRALARARRKSGRAGLAVRWDRGFSEDLPYGDGSFDRVLSSLMFHHLDADAKRATLREVRRVLTPGGTLHLLDFGGSRDASDGFMARIAHRNHMLEDNFGDRIPTLMREAGFVEVGAVAHRIHRLMGRATYFRALAPDA